MFAFIVLSSFVIHFISKEDLTEDKPNTTHSDDTISLVKEIFVVIIANSRDKSSGTPKGYHHSRILEDLDIHLTERYILLKSTGFSCRFDSHRKEYTVSLHLGTSDQLHSHISRSLLENFSYVKRDDGQFIKGFIFSDKKSSTRYYENNYLC